MMNRRLILPLLLTLALTALIFTDALPWLRGPAPETSEWFWVFGLRPFLRWWLPVLTAVGMAALCSWWLRAKQWRLGLVLLVMGNLLLQGALVYAAKPAVLTELIERTLANETNGYFPLAADTADLSALLADYPALMPTFPSEHTRTHPPGLVAANWLALKAFAAWPGLSQPIAERIWPLRCTDLWLLDNPPATAAALAAVTLLTALAGALVIWPTYGLARRLLPEDPARLAAGFAATLPALLIFTPTPVQIDALLAVTAVYLLQIGLDKQQNRWFFLSGLIVSLATFLSLGNAALLLLLVAYAGLQGWLRRAERPFAHLAFQLAALGLGATAVWLIYWAGWGVPPWTIAQVGLAQHYDLVTSHRRYDWWLFYNLLDLLIFTGPVIIVGYLGALLSRRIAGRSPIAALLVPLTLLILLLDVSGSARGEVGRLWLFLMPFLAIGSAAYYTPAPENRTETHVPLVLIGLQLLLVLALGLAWRPIEAVIVVAERPSLPSNPTPQTAVNAPFYAAEAADPAMTLRGYDLTQGPDTLDLTLYWQAHGAAQRPYTVFTHLVDAQGVLAAQQDNWPVNGRWPPTCWQNETIVADSYQLSLAGLSPGTYTLYVGWYDARDNTRLRLPDGQDALRLTTIVISH